MNNHRSIWKHLPLPVAILLFGSWLAWGQATSTKTQHDKPAAQNPGERAFQENCGRCHNPPEQLSPRITGTVLRHMRVRAVLSPQDERDILKYLAP
jgi:hypothetical protein